MLCVYLQVSELAKSLLAEEHQTLLMQEKVSGYKASLSEAHETTRIILEEKQLALEQKEKVEANLVLLQRNVYSLQTEVESGNKKERELKPTLEKLNEVLLA